MTVLELPDGNGAKLPYKPPRTINDRVDDRREAAYARYAADGGSWTIAKVAAELDLGQRQAGTVSREWKRRFAANGGSSASGVLPPPSPAPRAIDKAPRPQSAASKLVGTVGPNRRIHRGKVRRDPVRIALAAVVAAVMAAVSYHHIVELAILAGAGWPAWVLPLALDGMVALSIRCLVVDGLRDPVAWLGLGLGFAGSAAANVYAYRPDLIDLDQAIIVIGLSPAVSFLIAGWLLERGATR